MKPRSAASAILSSRARSTGQPRRGRLRGRRPVRRLRFARPALSVTRIETLRRDPYAIYAEFILGLKALDPVERELGPRDAGKSWHAALQEFSEKYPSGPLPPEAREMLFSIARARFAPLSADPAFAALNWPNIEKSLDFVLDFERQSRGDIQRVWVERRGEIVFPLASGAPFKLTARADRIDALASGGARLIDYKSGTPPGANEVKVGFAPQLTLEAAMLRRGGFDGLPALEADEALYLKLGGAGRRRGEPRRRQRRRYPSPSPRSISPGSRCCSTSSPARRPLTCRARSPSSPAGFCLTTISRASRNGRRTAASANSGDAP